MSRWLCSAARSVPWPPSLSAACSNGGPAAKRFCRPGTAARGPSAKLENSLSEVTDGLALAFDATALALALTMLTMFLSFMVERAEQAILDTVDRYTERELAHRFERTGPAGNEFALVARHHSEALVQA